MASIFTFDPDPPRVSSPWSTPPLGSRSGRSIPQDSSLDAVPMGPGQASLSSLSADDDCPSITRLEAEPQEGPTEYKLHLLLRRRRSFTRTSTGRHVSGSLRRAETPALSAVSRSASESGLLSSTPPALSSIQSRQHRFEQLTTQLLWRMQQSCAHHENYSTALVLPQLPDEAQLANPPVLQPLLPGLEESKGALYEIGVADDGTFVGLADDEMETSVNVLCYMAASLGCRVDLQRMVQIGDCEWVGAGGRRDVPANRGIQTGKLWVAEALVHPHQRLADDSRTSFASGNQYSPAVLAAANCSPGGLATGALQRSTEQLRVSLTGATGSGKSSLLGVLTTATLDNGHGSNRLSLLKHRHEIASGMTSSVTQELIGYQEDASHAGAGTQVINYGAENVASWVDIHVSAEGGRLVFLSDSAGHLRFRRTTVRGLVGWDPHWTLLCIPADGADDSSGRLGASPGSNKDATGPTPTDVDLSQSHLQLCLNLDLPLVVIITKLDLANKTGLKQTLSKVLSAIKHAGRLPRIVPKSAKAASEHGLRTISGGVFLEVRQVLDDLRCSFPAVVPIIFMSSVDGTGISQLHAFLRELPLPEVDDGTPSAARALFYIEDVYSHRAASSKPDPGLGSASDRSTVVGGHLRRGRLRVGDELFLGPYPSDAGSDDSDSGSGRGLTPPSRSHRNSAMPTSRSFPGALHKGQPGHAALSSVPCSGDRAAEWRRVRIDSLRNLRIPVQTLLLGQVGTIGIVPLGAPVSSPAIVRIRKGMVLADEEHKASRVIEVTFSGDKAESVKSLGVGSAVVVYVASVRASAKVVNVAPEGGARETGRTPPDARDDEEVDAFGFDFGDDGEGTGLEEPLPATSTVVAFQFIGSREFVDIDAKVLVLPGGGPGLYGGTERGEKGMAGLEGFVGRVVDGY